MNKLKLLPRWCRILGLTIIIPLLLGFLYNPDIIFGDIELPFMDEPENSFSFHVPSFLDQNDVTKTSETSFVLYSWVKKDISNELLLTIMLVGTYLVAFAKVKEEDEFSERLRLESMSLAIVWNSIILLIMNWLFYDAIFLLIMATQLFSFLLIFSFIFALKIRKQRRALSYEE